jgi:eukaryotic-like serine/threonine-protein kinase
VASICRCFIQGSYFFNSKFKVDVIDLKNFLYLLKSVSKDKQKIISNNIWQRLDSIKRYAEEPDSLPY